MVKRGRATRSTLSNEEVSKQNKNSGIGFPSMLHFAEIFNIHYVVSFMATIKQSAKDKVPAEMFKRCRVKLFTHRYFLEEFTALFLRIFLAILAEKVYTKNITLM